MAQITFFRITIYFNYQYLGKSSFIDSEKIMSTKETYI
jgi:hypothetical protein